MGLLNFTAFSSHSRAVEHDVSFDLKTARSPRRAGVACPQKKTVYLPMEIIIHILETAYFNDEFQPDDQLLRSCALVCRSWSGPAQKLLFRRVSLRNKKAFHALAAALDQSTERGRALGDAVIGMHVVLDHNHPHPLSQRSFAHAVTLCPNLYEIDLFIYGRSTSSTNDDFQDSARAQCSFPSFSDDTLSLLRSGPRITALQYSNPSSDSAYLFQLLGIWTTLKSLGVRGVPPQVPAACPNAFSGSLEELRISFQSKPSPDFIKWLLHNSTRSLRILELEREPSNDMLQHLLSEHGATLESLALPSCDSKECARAVAQCEKLKEFKIESCLGSPVVYKMLPEGIQHVALGVDKDTPLEAVLSMVKTREELRVLTLQVWDNGLRHPTMPSLRMECAMRGIELRLARDIRVFRAMIRGDPVPSSSFPRSKSLSNIHHMQKTQRF